jgi:hypothetical protein
MRNKGRFCRQVLAALDQAAAGGEFEDFQTLEYLLVQLFAPGAGTIVKAQGRMAAADVVRWQTARSAMFSKVAARLEVSTS